jgi:hypothetical protein
MNLADIRTDHRGFIFFSRTCTLVVNTHRPENLFGLDAVLTLCDGRLVA